MAVNKKAGKKSLAQNDFLEPLAPINVVATDVGTARPFDSAAASVSFELPANSPAAISFTASGHCSTHNTTHTATGPTSPIVVTGFGSNIDVVFTVTATNASGTTQPSSPSATVRVTSVPATPSAPSVSSPNGASYDTVSWTAPANGGKAITGYTVNSSDGKTGTTANTSININQEQGSSQSYTVIATNANGNSQTSSPSGTITTFSFVPFSVFGFFGFQPFSVFGFFGFAPWFYDG